MLSTLMEIWRGWICRLVLVISPFQQWRWDTSKSSISEKKTFIETEVMFLKIRAVKSLLLYTQNKNRLWPVCLSPEAGQFQPVCSKVLVKCKSSNIQHENVGEWFEFLRQIPFVNIAKNRLDRFFTA